MPSLMASPLLERRMLFRTSYAMAIHLAGLTHQYISWLPMLTFLRAVRHVWNAGTLRGPPEPMDQSPSSQLWLRWIMLIVVWASVGIFHHQQSDSYASACPDESRCNGQDDVILLPTNQRRAQVYKQHLQPPTDRLELADSCNYFDSCIFFLGWCMLFFLVCCLLKYKSLVPNPLVRFLL